MKIVQDRHRRRGRALRAGLLGVVAAVVVAYALAQAWPRSPIDAHAAHVAVEPARAAPAAATPQDERWAPDESSRGTRPDALH